MSDVDILTWSRQREERQAEATATLEAYFLRYGILSCQWDTDLQIAHKVGLGVVEVMHAIADMRRRNLVTVELTDRELDAKWRRTRRSLTPGPDWKWSLT